MTLEELKASLSEGVLDKKGLTAAFRLIRELVAAGDEATKADI